MARKTEKEEGFAQIVSSYTSRFGKDDDQTAVTEAERKKRQQNAAEVADSYYNFATSAYENGWSQHFHYTPFAPDDTIHSAMCFYEHRLALLMGLRPGMKVLDVGCGIGGPAREIAKFVGCEIVGISINQMQIDRAIHLTAQAGLSDKCTFVRGDFLNLPFAPGSFDAAYAIEATVHAPSLLQVYSNIARVLKPGAVFGLSEWVLTPAFDATDSRHLGIRNRLERGNGLTNLQTSAQAREAVVGAGFDIFHDEDFAAHFGYLVGCAGLQGGKGGNGMEENKRKKIVNNGVQKPEEEKEAEILQGVSPVLVPFLSSSSSSGGGCTLRRAAGPSSTSFPPSPSSSSYRPWWWPLAGQTSLATTWTDYWTAWKMSRWPLRACYALMWTLERLGLVDRGVCAAMTTLAYCVDSAVEGGSEGIFSPCWWFVARKMDDAEPLPGRQAVLGTERPAEQNVEAQQTEKSVG